MKYKFNFISFKTSLLFINYRVDKVLSKYLPQYSRKDILFFINNKFFLYINKSLFKKNILLKFRFLIKLNIKNFSNKVNLCFLKKFISVVYEDDYIIIINKPPGITIHPIFDNWNNTLVNNLLYYFGYKILFLFRLGIFHRLDKYTSGLLLIFKFNSIYLNFLLQTKYSLINKYYVGFLQGNLNFSGKILGYIKFFFKKKKFFFCKKIKKFSNTSFILFNTFKLKFDFKDFNYISIIKCNLKSGKTHQIRIHLNFLGYPILYDNIYKFTNKVFFNKYLCRLALHSYFITFYHPVYRFNNFCSISLYADMLNFFKFLIK